MSNTDLTSHQLEFLKRLNHLLIQKEKETWDRCCVLAEQYKKRLKINGGDLTDYELEISIDYYSSGRHSPRYTYTSYISKSDFKEGPLTFGSDNDWSDPSFPDLSEPWSYPMHCLWDHSQDRKNIFRITDVWIEVHIGEQQSIKFMDYKIQKQT